MSPLWAKVAAIALALIAANRGAAAGEDPRVEFTWPTPSTAWAEGKSPAAFLQQAGSGDPASGGFGGVRSGGAQFHEGIDIAATKRDRRGEPTDSVYAAMDGVVRHISRVAGGSSYGRYIVLEHPELTPAVYTLYAHLAQIEPGLHLGDRVTRGQTLAIMGHTAGGYTIPRDRAHLHFEIGLMITRDFQSWYDGRKFGSANEHNLWNGMNLMGLDPLDFLTAWRSGQVSTFEEYFARLPIAATVRIATHRVPDFIQRYPSLEKGERPMLVGGWEVRFDWTGLPVAWRSLSAAEVAGLPANRPVIVDANAEIERRQRSKSIAVKRGGQWVPGSDLSTVLQQLFGVR